MMPIAAMRMRTQPPPWSPLQLPSIFAAYDPTDSTKLWQDSARTVPVTAHNDPVGCIDDITGNGHHLLQATATSRGLWQSTGGVLMDGVDDNYVEASGSNIAIPVYMAMAYNKPATSTSGVSIFRLSPASNSIYVYLAGANSTTLGFASLQTRNGTAAENAHTPNGSWNAGGPAVVLDGLLVAGTSDVQINNDPLVSAANTQASGTTMTSALVRLSGSGFTAAAPAGTFHGGIVSLADPGAMRADAKEWLAARAGITI